jgi:hypothetical protein
MLSKNMGLGFEIRDPEKIYSGSLIEIRNTVFEGVNTISTVVDRQRFHADPDPDKGQKHLSLLVHTKYTYCNKSLTAF